MAENKYLKILIHSPDRDFFSYLQQNIFYEDVEMYYFANLSEIEDFMRRIRPHLFITYVHPEELVNEKALIFYKSPLFKDVGVIFILPNQIDLGQLRNLGEFNKALIFSEETSREFIAHNIRAILRKEKLDLEEFDSREYSENLLTCSKLIHQESKIPALFEKLIHFLPKILPYDYTSLFAFDPETNQVKNFYQFVPPHRRNVAILTPKLEKLAEVWMTQGQNFHVTINQDPSLFKKLNEWGWTVKQIYFFPIIAQKLSLGGIILGQMNLVRKSNIGISFLKEINTLLANKLYNHLVQEKTAAQKDDFTEQLVYNRFSEDSILQLSCKKLNHFSKSDNTIFWQINRGFGFLFPKYSYSSEEKPSWKSLERTMLYLEKDSRLNNLISSEKISLVENIYEDSKFESSTLETFKKLGYNSLLIAPVRIENEQLGIFVINRNQNKNAFNSWEVNQISGLLDKIRKVLEDTLIVKEANLKLKQLSRMFELGNEIKLELNLTQILAYITKSIRKTLGWNDVSVIRSNGYSKTYENISKIGFDNKEELPVDFLEDIPSQEIEKFLLNCRKINHSYFFDTNPFDINGNGSNFLDDVATEWQKQDLLMVPIESRKNMLGFLAVRDPVNRMKPNRDSVMSLEYFANQAAVAMENASLYENLQLSEERYRTLAETMTLALVTCSSAGKILYVNPAFQKLVGFNIKKLLKQPLFNYFSEESKTRLHDISQQVAKVKDNKSQQVENVELELLSSEGEIIPVSTFAFPYLHQSQLSGFFLVLSDLRVIKKLERLKADFNSMIVHDLRSPLNVIQGFIELIRTRVVGEVNTEQEELLDIAKENVKKVLNLVDNFLVASKLEVGKFGIDPKVGEINGIVERIVENHRVLLKNKKISLDHELNNELPLLYFDGLRIEQVLNNLLSNAVKFTPENGKISVTTELHSQTIKGEEKFFARLAVSDSGPGIPPEKVESIFEKYEQVDSELTPKSTGTGLGLAICKEIVNLHGGDIWVESKKNKGSKFYFTLPIEPSIDKFLK
jgi:PAS domain S-box-containing protein